MLPVVRGEDETRRQILLYTVLLYAVTQLPFCAGGLGVAYLVASMLLGAAFIYCAVRLLRSRRPPLGAPHLPLLARLPGAALPLDGARPRTSEQRLPVGRLIEIRPWIARPHASNMTAGLVAGGIRRRRSSPSPSSSPSSTSPHERRATRARPRARRAGLRRRAPPGRPPSSPSAPPVVICGIYAAASCSAPGSTRSIGGDLRCSPPSAASSAARSATTTGLPPQAAGPRRRAAGRNDLSPPEALTAELGPALAGGHARGRARRGSRPGRCRASRARRPARRPSKTTRWRIAAPRHLRRGALEAPVGRGGDHAARSCGRRPARRRGPRRAPTEMQQVALGDDAGRRRLVVADQRRPGSLLDHLAAASRSVCDGPDRQRPPPTSHPSPASRPPLVGRSASS